MELIKKLEGYVPFNDQEEKDREEILSLIRKKDNIFSRENTVFHMTASAWTVNRDRTKVLMAYHKIYDTWAWLGGHADGETDLVQVALKEVREESGLDNVRCADGEILSVEILPVSGHEKKGKYVSSHLHLNVTFLVEADENEELKIRPDENSALAWFTPEEALAHSDEEWFKERIYKKLISKVNKLK